jgi:hypothetical protein
MLKRYPSADSVAKALAMTVVAGLGDDTILQTSAFDRANISDRCLPRLEQEIASIIGVAPTSLRISSSSVTRPKQTSEKFDDLPFKFVCHDRLLYLTNKGFIGLGPALMCVGDLVCVLFGGITPFILRPCLITISS